MKGRFRRASPKSHDAWQLIYMDLITNIMAFFVILWTLSQGKSQGISETVGDVTTRLVHLPGDVLFPPGKASMSEEGETIIGKLFASKNGNALDFAEDGLTKRQLYVHGHTDSLGDKDENLQLGFDRALAAYQSIRQHLPSVKDHVVICSHADNTPVVDVPKVDRKLLSEEQAQAVRKSHSRNRRITLEDKIISKFEKDE